MDISILKDRYNATIKAESVLRIEAVKALYEKFDENFFLKDEEYEEIGDYIVTGLIICHDNVSNTRICVTSNSRSVTLNPFDRTCPFEILIFFLSYE